MFARMLYADEERSLQINWMGLGALTTVDKFGGVRRATSLQKSYFMGVIEGLSKRGVSIEPNDNTFKEVCESFAEALESSPSSLVWQVMFSRSPDDMAAEIVQSQATD
jgi:hypothetical protein